MPTIEITRENLLEAVRQMSPGEFDAFIERAMRMRSPAKAATLSAEESRLIERINRGLSAELSRRLAELTRRRKDGRLSAEEHDELLKLSHGAETQDADRAAALLELAKLRRVPLRSLMKQMGIKPRPVHG